jgi:GT2 family glycosyltransferase
MKLTHVISTYNSLEFLKLAIASVRKNSFYRDAPFVVFADGCTDGTDQWLIDNQKKYDLTLLIEPRNENSSNGYGMNRAAELVQTEYINFIHADMYVAPNFDKALIESIEAYPYTERVLISSYRIQPNLFHNGQEPDRPGTVMVSTDLFGDMPENFKVEEFEEEAFKFQVDNKDVEFAKAEGCSFLIKKRDWDFIGGNDLRFKPNGYEDMDLFLRMRNEGFKYKVIGSSVVFHFAGRGGNGFFGSGLEKRNESNYIGEQKSGSEFLKKWGGIPVFDQYGMILKIQK